MLYLGVVYLKLNLFYGHVISGCKYRSAKALGIIFVLTYSINRMETLDILIKNKINLGKSLLTRQRVKSSISA